MQRDDAPRQLELTGAFAGLSFTHRRECVTWIAEARQSETRDRRAAKAVELLLAGVKHP
ncbi:MAG: YdeI/OmpD-associated family protein [Thermoleophilaceae bacterium]